MEKYATKYIIFSKICQVFPTGGKIDGQNARRFPGEKQEGSAKKKRPHRFFFCAYCIPAAVSMPSTQTGSVSKGCVP